MESNKNIFDWIIDLPFLRWFKPIYIKYREMLLYLFFGGLSFVVSIATYALFNIELRFNELIANIFSWIITVMFAFLTNRVWVFQTPTKGKTEFVKQMLAFYSGRVVTLIIEEVILLFFIILEYFLSAFSESLSVIFLLVYIAISISWIIMSIIGISGAIKNKKVKLPFIEFLLKKNKKAGD